MSTLAALDKNLKSLVRPCWTLETVEKDKSVQGSKFSGRPWLSDGEPWPVCKVCNKPLAFFLQLNSAELPQGAKVAFKGLLQLFFCTNSESNDCLGFQAFSKSVFARVIVPTGKPSGIVLPSGGYSVRSITGWKKYDDAPSWIELGSEFSDNAAAMDQLVERYSTATGDKLLGWPAWAQGPEYPKCKKCRKPMSYVFQIDSNDHLQHTFGDCGCGHVFHCATDNLVAFTWACG